MSDLFDEMNNQKDKLQKMTAPPEFEDLIRGALNKKKSWKPNKFILIASLLVVFFLTVYNSQTLAYYARQILGFNQVMSHNLQTLNKAGNGQVINKTCSLKSGIKVTLNGVISDKNQLIAYITLKSMDRDLTQYSLRSNDLTGFFSHSRFSSGMGKISDDHKEIKWEWKFTPPSFFAKKLTMHLELEGPNNYHDSGEISFHYDRSKAMPLVVQKSINQKVTLDQSTLVLKELNASPTTTIVTGNIAIPEGLLKYTQDPTSTFELALVANGKPVDSQGNEMHSGFSSKMNFSINYDPLPQPLKSLKVKIVKVPVSREINESIPLSDLEPNSNIVLQQFPIQVLSKKVNNDQSTLTLKMNESIYLKKILVQSGNEDSIGKETDINYEKEKDGIKRIVTYTFNTKSTPDKLVIKDYYFSKVYNKEIDIPVK